MQIVIDISDEQYKKAIEFGHLDMCGIELAEAVLNGTPLPKGHGRLIDGDALGEELHRYTEAPYQYALKVFNDAPTIIESDKEE